MTAVKPLEKSVQELWNDYHFLTKEMVSFLDKQDLDFFIELMEQRETLQTMIETVEDDDFLLSASGQNLLQSIQRMNHTMMLKLQYLINNSRNQHNVSRAYDSLGTEIVGNRMDRQT